MKMYVYSLFVKFITYPHSINIIDFAFVYFTAVGFQQTKANEQTRGGGDNPSRESCEKLF
jgi:hypothetical protein